MVSDESFQAIKRQNNYVAQHGQLEKYETEKWKLQWILYTYLWNKSIFVFQTKKKSVNQLYINNSYIMRRKKLCPHRASRLRHSSDRREPIGIFQFSAQALSTRPAIISQEIKIWSEKKGYKLCWGQISVMIKTYIVFTFSGWIFH